MAKIKTVQGTDPHISKPWTVMIPKGIMCGESHQAGVGFCFTPVITT